MTDFLTTSGIFSESFEFGQHKGLNLVKGKVVRFKRSESEEGNFKIPQMGWNKINIPSYIQSSEGTNNFWDSTICDKLKSGTFFYFVHSFICIPNDINTVLSETEYGKDCFCSTVRHENIWGTQYHPEKSGRPGLKVYENFLYKL